jgi:hypothetical protein
VKRTERDMIDSVFWSPRKVPVYSCYILTKLEFSRNILEKSSNTKFHENPSSGSRVVPCREMDRRTDMMNLIVAFRYFANALKKWILGSHNFFLSLYVILVSS